MAGSDLADRFVFLRGGVIVPAAPFLLLLDLERRGFAVEAEGESTLWVRPPDRLTDADCIAIRRWKPHLLLLVAYCQQPHDAHLFS